MHEIRVRVGVCARSRVCVCVGTCKVCIYSMYTERRTRMVRPSNNNPMLMSGGSSFSRLTLRSRLSQCRASRAICLFDGWWMHLSDVSGEFYGKLVCTVTSTNDTTLFILSFFPSSFRWEKKFQEVVSGRSITRQPESIAFFLGVRWLAEENLDTRSVIVRKFGDGSRFFLVVNPR